MDKIEEVVKRLTIEIAMIEDINIQPETDFIDELAFDSIKFVVLLSAIEDELDITFDAEEMQYEKIKKFNNLIEVIHQIIARDRKDD